MILSVLAVLAALTAATPRPEVRNVRISSPKIALSRERADSEVQLTGQFKVEMSFPKNTVKKPVMRLACLCEVNGALVANGIFLDRPETSRGMSRSEIQAAFKDAGLTFPSKEREKFLSDPAQFTPYLAEVSKTVYASAKYGTADLKHGFFRLGRSEKQQPRLLLYRIEVWQNGALAASFDSSRNGLGNYEIPDDWHVWKKYPQKFKYVDFR